MGKRKLRRKKINASANVSVQFSSVQSLDRLGRRGDMRSDSAEILFQSFLLEALVSSPGMGRDVHSLMLSMQHFLCRPRRRPPSKVPRRMILERLSSSVTCPEPCKFPSLDSCQMRCLWTHKEVDLAFEVGLVLQGENAEKVLHALGFESQDHFLLESASGFHSHRGGWR